MFYSRNPEISGAELDNEILAFNPLTAKYLTFNETASFIWKILEKPTKLKDIYREIEKSYTINNSQIEEINFFLDEAVKFGLVNFNENNS